MLSGREPEAGRRDLGPGFGLALIAAGLVHAVGFFLGRPGAGLTVSPPTTLVIALAMAGAAAFLATRRDRRPAPADLAGAGFCLLAGLLALGAMASGPQDGRVWAGSLGTLAILWASWRGHGLPLALLTLAACLYVLVWQTGTEQSLPAMIGILHGLTDPLISGLASRPAGWLLDMMLSLVLPAFLLGGLLASRHPAASGSASRRAAALASFVHQAIPTLMVGLAVIMNRPAPDPMLVAAAWLPAIGAALALLRRDARAAGRDLAREGAAFAGPMIAAAAVAVVLAIAGRTALPIDAAQILVGAAGEAAWPLLVLAAVGAMILTGLVPGFAALLLVVALIGPAVKTAGGGDATLHAVALAACLAGLAIKAVAQAASEAGAARPAMADPSGNAAAR